MQAQLIQEQSCSFPMWLVYCVTACVMSVAVWLNPILPICVSPVCAIMLTSLKASQSKRSSISVATVNGMPLPSDLLCLFRSSHWALLSNKTVFGCCQNAVTDRQKSWYKVILQLGTSTSAEQTHVADVGNSSADDHGALDVAWIWQKRVFSLSWDIASLLLWKPLWQCRCWC